MDCCHAFWQANWMKRSVNIPKMQKLNIGVHPFRSLIAVIAAIVQLILVARKNVRFSRKV